MIDRTQKLSPEDAQERGPELERETLQDLTPADDQPDEVRGGEKTDGQEVCEGTM